VDCACVILKSTEANCESPQTEGRLIMAADLAQIEQRLSLVEAALAEVRNKLGLAPSTGTWVENISGSLADIPEEDYQQFLDCCRAVRSGGDISTAEDPQ
jgi:hypothetical protein